MEERTWYQDGASTQSKLYQFIEESSKEKGTLIDNKCSIHIGVNLRAAQVKALHKNICPDHSGELSDSDNKDNAGKVSIPSKASNNKE